MTPTLRFVRNILVSFILLALGGFLLWIASFDIPDLKTFEERRVAQSTKIYDRTGEILLYDLHQNTKRTIVPFAAISRDIKNATIAIEDTEFYQHGGIKPSSIIRAMLVNLALLDFSQGGSTITQQVVKNSILTSEKRISRKIKEGVLSIKLEKVLSKDQILALYLNETPYGGSIYGVEEASQEFFGKSAQDVSLAEAAYLAALPQAPTFYSPYGNHVEKLHEREQLVLKKMVENRFITEKEYEQAKKEKVSFNPPAKFGIRAPHFVMYVVEYLEKKYGKNALEQGGLKVITTLDAALQEKGEEIAKQYALKNATTYRAENVSIVAIDPKTGGILTMVGSRDYFDKTIDGNFNVALAHRQPGSAFKPFVYATAFQKGLTPETVVFDVPTEFSTECTPEGNPRSAHVSSSVCYMPVNYDGIYRGPIMLRNALAQSINIPAIKVLYLAGLKDSLQTAKNFGITSLSNINRYGLTLVLGGGEVSLLDLTSAYSVFANDGIRNPYTAILKITKDDGSIVEQIQPRPARVVQENIARTISDILSDNMARTPAFGANSPLFFPERSVAAKTGTTNDYRDAWIVGYTPDITIGAWAGNNDNSPMEKKVAGFIVAPLWHEFMSAAIANIPEQRFERPRALYRDPIKPILRGVWQGGVVYMIDSLTGKLATEYTPEETRKERVVQGIHSILYWVDKTNIGGPPLENPTKDPQYEAWEYAVRKWAQENGYTDENPGDIPAESDTIHTPEKTPVLAVMGIHETIPYRAGDSITLSVQNTTISSGFSLARADFYLNGVLLGSTTAAPISYSFTLDENTAQNLQRINTVRIIGYDTVYNKGEVTVSFLFAGE